MRGRRGEAWNDEDIATLRRLSADDAPVAEIARALERSREAVSSRARKLRLRVRS